MSDAVFEKPGSWAYTRLGEFLIKGAGSVNPVGFPDEVFELYSIPAYDKGKPELSKGREIGSTKKVVREGDVLISRIVPHIQRSWVVPKANGHRQIGSSEWIIFHGDCYLPAYMKYFLLSPAFHQKYMKTISGVGGSLTRANPDQVAEFQFPLPPLAEQERIVAKIEELFSSLDKGIENLTTAQEQLKVYRQAVLKEAFEGKVTNKNVKDGELPEGWLQLYLKDICDLIGGVTKGRNLSGKKTISLPYLRVANVQDGYLDLKNIKQIDVLDSDLDKYRLISGDILYTEGGDRDKLGRGTVWNGEIKNCIHQNHIFRARLDKTRYLPKYVAYFSQTKRAKDYFYKNGKQTTNLASINMTILSNLQIVLPIKIEEQIKVVSELENRLSLCDKLEEGIARSLEQAEALRQSILKKAFEGKLVSQDPHDEPASVLLERIRAQRESGDNKAPRTRAAKPARAEAAPRPAARKRGRPRKADSVETRTTKGKNSHGE